MSRMTRSTPWPMAPPTSSFPRAFGGSMAPGTLANPLTFPDESAVTVTPRMGPSPWICRVRRSRSPFIITPIIAAAESILPTAAVTTGLLF